MISMLLWQKEEKKNLKTKHSIWFSRRSYNSIFHSILLPLQQEIKINEIKKQKKQLLFSYYYTVPPYLSSKLYFRMWNYYCGKLQLCWKLYCQPVNINDDSIPTKCCTRSMNSYEWEIKVPYYYYYSIWIMKFWFKNQEK